jgi:hypothetical protein
VPPSMKYFMLVMNPARASGVSSKSLGTRFTKLPRCP